MANLEIKLSANKRQPYLRHRVVGRVGEGGLTTINVQLLEEDEITPFVINLNGTLKFVGEVSNGNYTEGEPEIIDSTNGLISYTFTKSNFSTSHQFKQAYFEYVDPNGKKVTFQNFIIDVLERVDINSEQAKYYISSLEKLQSEMQTTFNQFISDKQVQYDQIYSKYNELVRLINESDKQANDRIDKANDRIDQTNQQIGDLGKLKKMYSNSIDFGDYDYSGNPNLMPVLKAKDFSPNSQITIEDSGNSLKVTFADSEGAKFLTSIKSVPALLPGTQYTLSADVTVLEGYKGDLNSLRLTYRKTPGGTILLAATAKNAQVGKKTKIYATANSSEATDPSIFDRMYFTIDTNFINPFVGTVLIENIKVERGSKATPYQPNLLDDPYYLSKVALGENLIKPESQQPVTNSNYLIKIYNTKPMVKGKKYTITLEGTKPATQVFRPLFTQATGSPWGFGDLKPVEGLTDIWSATFTASTDSHPTSPQVQIYQAPNTSVGQCTIKWVKLEEGDTRTPNISQFKYFGEGLKDSNNPNDYSWDVTPEYTEKGLNNTVSLTEPQSIEGLKNFEDGIQSKGKSVLTSDDNKYEVVTLTVTNGNTGSAKLYREGKTVSIYFVALNGKSSGGNDSTILTIPEGYRPPISFEQLVGSIDRSTLNSAQLSIGADGAIKWRRNSSYGSDYTFAITYTI
ncbi:BppU family phage baseplate upper protein [Enterococcus sp. DIV0733a]|uniref:BppU family phage baseplate upper protein n=1 Tax=Enterococcus sp. DIV0733a TaxID=2774780 RepID=UPI003F275F13